MKPVNFNSWLTVSLTSEQKKRFREYVPDKVYHREKNISLLVAATQALCRKEEAKEVGQEAFERHHLHYSQAGYNAAGADKKAKNPN